MSVESVPVGCVLDVPGTLARLGGDGELFREIAGFFYEDAPRLLASLRSAVDANDAKEIRMTAHALKGLVAGCGGVRATSVAQKLETAGQNGELDHASSLVNSMGEELGLLKQALMDYHA